MQLLHLTAPDQETKHLEQQNSIQEKGFSVQSKNRARTKEMYTPPKEADKNAKSCLFPNQNNSLVLTMDDKAFLCPGTDVGFLATKSGKIYDLYNHEKQRKPPQHDFSTPELHITPSSFRFMTGHQEIIDGKLHLVNDKDQT